MGPGRHFCKEDKSVNICVVGTGYVGLVTGVCFAEFGLNVAAIDNDKTKIDLLKKGEVPIYEPGLKEKIAANVAADRLIFTTNIKKGVANSLVVFIAVGTPQGKDGRADLSYIDEVAKSIGENMNGYKVIVTKSTVPVGTGERIKKIVEEHQKEKVNFDVVSNPEFLREGAAIEDFMRPDRVVIGASSSQAIAIMKDLYRPLYLRDTPFVITSIKNAEMIKYASNAFLATKISFINEVANICERVGADVQMVATGMGLDDRIGPYFLHAGPGYGGSCFPKDTEAFVRIADEHGYSFEIVKSAINVNNRRIEDVMKKIARDLGAVEGKTIGFLGLAFKPDTDDIREAPSIKIIKKLLKQGAKIKAFDPSAMENTRKELPKITYCKDAYEVADGADALVICTEWTLFRNLDLGKIKKALKVPVLIDLKNIYDKEKMNQLGIKYTGIGR